MKLPRASLAALLTAQAQETFNDCAAKMMLGALAQQLARAQGVDPKPILAIIAALLVLPYVAFGPVCGWLSDRYPKRTVLNATLVAQIGVMLLLVAALWLKSFDGAILCFFLLCAETAVLAPAKRGILLEYVGPRHLSRWVGYMEMFNITAILVGSFAGGAMFSHWFSAGGDPWAAAQSTAWVLTVLAVLAWALFQVAEPTKAHSAEPFRWSLWVRHFSDVAEVWRTRPLWRATMGICFFYGVGGYATVLLQQVGYELTHGGPGAGLASSQLLLMVGVGTMLGNLLAGLLSRRGVADRGAGRPGFHGAGDDAVHGAADRDGLLVGFLPRPALRVHPGEGRRPPPRPHPRRGEPARQPSRHGGGRHLRSGGQ